MLRGFGLAVPAAEFTKIGPKSARAHDKMRRMKVQKDEKIIPDDVSYAQQARQAFLQNSSFVMHNSSFLVHNSPFSMHNSSFVMHNSSFLIHNSLYFDTQDSSFLLTESVVSISHSESSVAKISTES